MAPQKRGIVSNVTKAIAQRIGGGRRKLRQLTQDVRRVGGRNVRGERGGRRGRFRRGR
jgi:hypothetical protein